MRRTKKEKLKSDLRKEKQLVFPTSGPTASGNKIDLDLSEVIGSVDTQSKIKSETEDHYSFFASDLKKLSIVAGIAIAIQFVAYLTLV